MESPRLRRKLRAYRYIITGLSVIIPGVTFLSQDIRLMIIPAIGLLGLLIEGYGLSQGITPDELKQEIKVEDDIAAQAKANRNSI